LLLAFNLGIEFFSEPIRKKIDAYHQEKQSSARKKNEPPHPSIHIIFTDGDHHPQGWFSERNPHTEETQGRFQHNGHGQIYGHDHKNWRNRVREEVLQKKPYIPRTCRLCSHDVCFFFYFEDTPAHCSGVLDPVYNPYSEKCFPRIQTIKSGFSCFSASLLIRRYNVLFHNRDILTQQLEGTFSLS